MRLIDADALITEAFDLMDRDELLEDVPQIIKDYCDAQPTVEAVPVVRCRDCIRWRQSKSNTAAKVCDWDWYEKTENDFCSWAKRKDDD